MAATATSNLDRLLAIMARLRDPVNGCPWDVAQTFATIAPYTIEEAYEVADACERGDLGDLRGELGDLLLQVVFHARMAEEAGAFAFDDVAGAIADKMERRHPHVFGDGGGGPDQWEAIKASERAAGDMDLSALAGVARALPALMRAEKVQKRAARVGFDWPDPAGARAKLLEEIGEVDDAATDDERIDEVGDLLFAAVNWSRKLGIDPEVALRTATAKFERRFRAMESQMKQPLASCGVDMMEAAWQDIKAQERAR